MSRNKTPVPPSPAPSPRWLNDAGASSPGAQALRQALDDAADLTTVPANRQRVWSRVQTPWAPGRGRIALGMGLLAAAAAAVVVVVGATRRTVAPVASRVGAPSPPFSPIAVAPPPVAAPPVASGTLLTGPGQRWQGRIAQGVDVELGPLTALLAGDEHTAPEVKSGQVRFAVPHQAPGRSYSVSAVDYRVVVLGTVFTVGVAADGVSVALDTGAVVIEDARSGQLLAHLRPGERWNSTAAAPGASEAAPSAARPAGASESSRPSAAQLLAQARQARKAGDARGALALYGRLAAGSGQLAESAAYEMASIEGEELHQPARALRSWERYRDQHPHGLLRAEADISIIEMLTRLGQSAPAIDEARSFLRRNPDSERRGEVARVAGDLARTRGDCGAAVSFYDQAAASRLSSSDADDVTYQRAACLSVMGDPRAAEAAAAYLGRFPRGRHADAAARLRSPSGDEAPPRR